MKEVEKMRIVVTAALEAFSGTTKLTEWAPSGKVPTGFAARAVILGRDEGQLALDIDPPYNLGSEDFLYSNKRFPEPVAR